MDKARLKLGAVPVRVAAKVYGRDPAWVRAGIIAGWLPIGEATRNGRRVTDLKEAQNTGESIIIFRRSFFSSRQATNGGAKNEKRTS